MKLQDVEILEPLKEILKRNLAGVVVYSDGRPTANLPDNFIELRQNGAIRSNSSKFGMFSGNVMLTVSVRTLPDGQTNNKKMKSIFSKIGSIFDDNVTVVEGTCHYNLSNTNSLYSGRSILSGYSTKILNLKVLIY